MYRTAYIYLAIELFIAWLIFLFACVIYPIFKIDFYAHLTYWNAQSAHFNVGEKYQIFHFNISEPIIFVCSIIVLDNILYSTIHLTVW